MFQVSTVNTFELKQKNNILCGYIFTIHLKI